MSGAVATSTRVLLQLRRDPRTIALLLLVPIMLIALLDWLFVDQPGVFDRISAPLLGLFPSIAMFVVTSITMLRERTTGTLERLMTLPLTKLGLLGGTAAHSLSPRPRRRRSSRRSRLSCSDSTWPAPRG